MSSNRFSTPQARLQPGTVINFSLSPRGLRELFDDSPRTIGAIKRYFGDSSSQSGGRYRGIVRACRIYDPLGLVSAGEWKFSRPPPEEILVECLDVETEPYGNRSTEGRPAIQFISHNVHMPAGTSSSTRPTPLTPFETLKLIDLNCCPLNAWPANYRQPLESTDPLAGLLPIMDIWVNASSSNEDALSSSDDLRKEWTTLKL